MLYQLSYASVRRPRLAAERLERGTGIEPV
jgi:hypothetical protein